EEHVARPPVPVPRPADRTDVAEHPRAGDRKPADTVLRSEKLPPPQPTLDEYSRDTGIPGETNPIEPLPDFAHLRLVVDVRWENVLTEPVSRRAVDIQHVALAVARRQPGQESEAALPNGGFLDRRLKQVSRPEDALLGTRSKPVCVKQDAVVED